MAFYRYEYKLAVVNGELVTKRKRELLHFGYKTVEKFIQELTKCGYKCRQVDVGTLLIGDWICIPPEKGDYTEYYVIRERYQNEWSSYMTIEPKRKLSVSEWKEVNT